MSDQKRFDARDVHPTLRDSVSRAIDADQIENGAFLELVAEDGRKTGTFAVVHKSKNGTVAAEAFVGTEDLTKPFKHGYAGVRARFKW